MKVNSPTTQAGARKERMKARPLGHKDTNGLRSETYLEDKESTYDSQTFRTQS